MYGLDWSWLTEKTLKRYLVLKSYLEDRLSAEEIALKFDYSIDLVKDLVKRIHQNEYKRKQAPPGLRISEKAFTVGRRFPIVQKWA